MNKQEFPSYQSPSQNNLFQIAIDDTNPIETDDFQDLSENNKLDEQAQQKLFGIMNMINDEESEQEDKCDIYQELIQNFEKEENEDNKNLKIKAQTTNNTQQSTNQPLSIKKKPNLADMRNKSKTQDEYQIKKTDSPITKFKSQFDLQQDQPNLNQQINQMQMYSYISESSMSSYFNEPMKTFLPTQKNKSDSSNMSLNQHVQQYFPVNYQNMYQSPVKLPNQQPLQKFQITQSDSQSQQNQQQYNSQFKQTSMTLPPPGLNYNFCNQYMYNQPQFDSAQKQSGYSDDKQFIADFDNIVLLTNQQKSIQSPSILQKQATIQQQPNIQYQQLMMQQNQQQMPIIQQNQMQIQQNHHMQQQNSHQQSNNVLIDQQESVLVNIMYKYEEAQNQQLKLETLRGSVVKLAINQTGSKFLQRLLDSANPQIVNFLLKETEQCLPILMIDNYGNYFCQRLLINCSSDQRMFILERISNDFVSICCNKKGTHTIQKFIDLVNLECEELFFKQVLTSHVAELSFDAQGTHVIQNIIKCFPEVKRQYIFEEIYDQFVELATNNCGLCVIKIIISKTMMKENRLKFMQKLIKHAIELAQNPYGNYAIQQAFEFWDKETCMDLIPQFFGKVYQLSMQKCSSNVIDRCIQNSSPQYLSIIMSELINCERLNNLIMNSYGNFVVQNALKFACQEDRVKLAEQIDKTLYGINDQRIKQKWTQLLKRKNLIDFRKNSNDTDSIERGKQKSVKSSESYSSGKKQKKQVYQQQQIFQVPNQNILPQQYQLYMMQQQNIGNQYLQGQDLSNFHSTFYSQHQNRIGNQQQPYIQNQYFQNNFNQNQQ